MSDTAINLFHVGGRYVFKHFFDADEIFSELQHIYDGEKYRFEISSEIELEDAEEVLAEHGYTLQLVEDLTPFCVVKDRSERYSGILRDAVEYMPRGDYNVFIMKDESAVEQAEAHDATPISDTDLPLPF